MITNAIRAFLLSFALTSTSAFAYDVYPGCATPEGQGKVWWVDPAKGKSPADGGDGSFDKPWNSLDGIASGNWTRSRNPPAAGYTRPLLSSVPYMHVVDGKWVAVADTLGDPPVAPGDTLNLMTGSYGDFILGDYKQIADNSKFVIVQAGPGQIPAFNTIYLQLAKKWVFDGITIKSVLGTNGNNRDLLYVADGGPSYPSGDLIFTNMRLSSLDNVAGLTQAQLQATLRYGYRTWGSAGDGTNGQPNLTCLSMTNSRIKNVKSAAILAGNKSLFNNNEISYFFDDGIIYSANGVTITHNYIHDNSDIGDGNHEDAMQGQLGPRASGVVENKYSDILIDSNRLIRQTDPKLPFPTYMQGIDAFDSEWFNVAITNNIIVTSACWGISSASTHGLTITGNTVVPDGLVAMPGNCNPIINAGGPSHAGPVGDHVWVAGNIAAEILLYDKVKPVQAWWGSNVVTAKLVNTNDAGAYVFNTKEGVDAWGNLLVRLPFVSMFRVWDPARYVFDVTPQWGSPPIGWGTTVGVPSTDIVGRQRFAPLTAGAYAYPF
jgi:hypothetical protein